MWEYISEYILADEIFKIALAALLGAILGIEREWAGKDPGLRTFTLIAMGSCLFSIVSISSAYGIPNAEPSRIAAQILPGIGFLGAGAIFRSSQRIGGLTTAALMWVTAAIGMAIGFDRIHLAIATTVIALIFVRLLAHVRTYINRENGTPT